MTQAQKSLLADLSPYVYGTTRLGDASIAFRERVAIAREAMRAGVWFHTSHTYGNALEVLRAAFDQAPREQPRLICKIGWSNITELSEVIRQNLEPLGLSSMDLGQLCLGGALAEQLASGGECYEEFQRLKRDGRVKRFVLEVFPWTSQAPLAALKAGYPEGVIDGYILYFNPLQRFASNELWDLLRERRAPIVAMRTVSGGDVHRLRDVPGAAWKPYLRERAAEVAPIFERAGVATWSEFCVRFAHSFPGVRATVGASSKSENLQAFLAASKSVTPLPGEIVSAIDALMYRWSDELDVKAEPWSM
jgi:hypothetical protein